MDGEERLQKIIAAAGLASRRKAETLILEGRVLVNGQVVRQLGAKADPGRDHIKVDGKAVRIPSKKTYILLNKPKQVISSVADPRGRTKVTDLVPAHRKLFPVGRLDYNTEGLILLTNDGAFSKIVTTAGRHMPKVYRAKVKSVVSAAALAGLRGGVRLQSGVALGSCRIEPVREGANGWYEVTLFEGKNRQVREMFESVGHPVLKLRRIRIGFLTDQGLEVGQYRNLTPLEVDRILRVRVAGTKTSSAGRGKGKPRNPSRER